MPAEKPAVLPEWASQDIKSPISGQWNVVVPPAEVMQEGWSIREKPNRQWWNWFNRTVYRWILWLNEQSSDVITDASGVGLFNVDDALITIDAVDRTDPTRFYRAVGYKAAGSAPVFSAGSIQSNVLELGVPTITGNQPIIGGNIVVVRGTSSKIPN